MRGEPATSQGALGCAGIGCNRHSAATGPLPNRHSGVGGAATVPLPNRHRSATDRVLARSLHHGLGWTIFSSNHADKSPLARSCQWDGECAKTLKTPEIPIPNRYSSATGGPADRRPRPPRGDEDSPLTNQLLYQLSYAGAVSTRHRQPATSTPATSRAVTA